MDPTLTRVGRRLAIYAGLAGPLTFMALYTFAAMGDPEYVFFTNYLSDLGVGERAVFFNAAVIIAGGLTIPFVLLAIRPVLDGGIAATAAVILTVVAAAFLILVGVYTEDYPDLHPIVSYGFFISMLAAWGCYSWTLHFSHSLGRSITEFTKTVTAIGIILVVFGFNPRTETVAVLLIVVWGLVVAITLFRRGTEADTY
jgi:hypothetical membrane protein